MQSFVNYMSPPAVEGDFASANPYASVLSVPGGLVAGPDGLTIGRFAFVDATDPSVANNHGTGPIMGFVHRAQNALILNFFGTASMTIPKGFAVTVHTQGDFWMRNSGADVVAGTTAYASTTDGTVTFAPANTVVDGHVATHFKAATPALAGELVKISSWI